MPRQGTINLLNLVKLLYSAMSENFAVGGILIWQNVHSRHEADNCYAFKTIEVCMLKVSIYLVSYHTD